MPLDPVAAAELIQRRARQQAAMRREGWRYALGDSAFDQPPPTQNKMSRDRVAAAVIQRRARQQAVRQKRALDPLEAAQRVAHALAADLAAERLQKLQRGRKARELVTQRSHAIAC